MKYAIDKETDGRWIAEACDLPGVMTYGATPQAALEACILLRSQVKSAQMPRAAAVESWLCGLCGLAVASIAGRPSPYEKPECPSTAAHKFERQLWRAADSSREADVARLRWLLESGLRTACMNNSPDWQEEAKGALSSWPFTSATIPEQ